MNTTPENPCPSWCDQRPSPEHWRSADRMDADHWSPGDQVDVSQHGALLSVCLRQPINAAAPSVLVSVDDDTDIGTPMVKAAEYWLTVAEADRLAALLAQHVALARGGDQHV